jgi:hypothetical protein
MLLKPEVVYPSSRYHPRDGNYTTTAPGNGCALPNSRQPQQTGNLFVADFYTGYTSADCPSVGGGGGGGGTYPMTSSSGLPLNAPRLPGGPNSYDVCAVGGVDDGQSANALAQRFYSAATEHIYESPKFDRKSTDYDDISGDENDVGTATAAAAAAARFQLSQNMAAASARLHANVHQDGAGLSVGR